MAEAMDTVTADVTQLAQQLTELGLRDWAAAATEQTVRGHVTAAFGALEERAGLAAKALLARLGDGPDKPGANAAAPLAEAFACTFEAIQRCTMAMLQAALP
ncbi:hypothetical protein MNEG_12598 [Monoraphidium neglectum]|uniref:Uncharacterized protein n=1 Tax=Monoraphidium neglectum TaxID=145388 RepID=A0A0D2MKC1_9CHLO|nr:hypothetical protein MNEG_12598 [Monoraphidium neglectum]KIY95365.1 hypothetical protein MNEG_12598 [Monoraphidium neglectum]|eukprot:XP_013894385.1 hypothetical protein MNEG_12598 [Monoraphidium neglectum]